MFAVSRSRLSDSALVHAAVQRVRDEARLTAEHLADLAEIDLRKAWRAEAFSSQMSAAAAFRSKVGIHRLLASFTSTPADPMYRSRYWRCPLTSGSGCRSM